jgi:hypothetical protein
MLRSLGRNSLFRYSCQERERSKAPAKASNDGVCQAPYTVYMRMAMAPKCPAEGRADPDIHLRLLAEVVRQPQEKEAAHFFFLATPRYGGNARIRMKPVVEPDIPGEIDWGNQIEFCEEGLVLKHLTWAGKLLLETAERHYEIASHQQIRGAWRCRGP